MSPHRLDVDFLLRREKELLEELFDVRSRLEEAHKKLFLRSELKLSARQQQVFMGLIENKPNKDISSAMHITVSAVKKHTSVVLKRYGVTNRHELKEKCLAIALARQMPQRIQ